MGKVTLKHIAENTGYSISTVSRVLNGSNKISDKTTKQVLDCAVKLNYSFNNSLNKNVSRQRIALIVSGIYEGEFYASFHQGIAETAEQNNIILSIVCLKPSHASFMSSVLQLTASHDGLILFTPEFKRNDYIELKEKLPMGYPVISNCLIENPVFTTITFDNYSGGHRAAEHFFDNNYLTCGVLKGPLAKTEARNRFNGFRDYIEQRDSMKLTWEYNGDYKFSSGSAAFEAFEVLDYKPRAIFAGNDVMAHAFMEAATKQGYHFPDDIAIVGFDNLPICQRHQPTITSIAPPYHQLGELVLKRLKSYISNSKSYEPVQSLLPVSLIKRASS